MIEYFRNFWGQIDATIKYRKRRKLRLLHHKIFDKVAPQGFTAKTPTKGQWRGKVYTFPVFGSKSWRVFAGETVANQASRTNSIRQECGQQIVRSQTILILQESPNAADCKLDFLGGELFGSRALSYIQK